MREALRSIVCSTESLNSINICSIFRQNVCVVISIGFDETFSPPRLRLIYLLQWLRLKRWRRMEKGNQEERIWARSNICEENFYPSTINFSKPLSLFSGELGIVLPHFLLGRLRKVVGRNFFSRKLFSRHRNDVLSRLVGGKWYSTQSTLQAHPALALHVVWIIVRQESSVWRVSN